MPFQVNERATLARAVRHGDKVIAAGSSGTVVDVDPDNGDVLFRLDRHYSCLVTWGNILPVDGYEADLALSPYTPLRTRLLQMTERFGHPAVLAALAIMATSIFVNHTGGSATAQDTGDALPFASNESCHFTAPVSVFSSASILSPTPMRRQKLVLSGE